MRKNILIYGIVVVLIGSGFVSSYNNDVESTGILDYSSLNFNPTDDTFITHSHPDETHGSELHLKQKVKLVKFIF